MLIKRVLIKKPDTLAVVILTFCGLLALTWTSFLAYLLVKPILRAL